MNIVLFLLISTFWGFSFIAIKSVIGSVPPFWSACFRVLLSFVFLSIFLGVQKKTLTVPKPLRISTWISGLCFQGVSFALLFWGEQYIPAGLASIINGTVPLWTALLVALWMRQDETWTANRIAGLLLGFLGLIIIFAPELHWQNTSLAFWGTCAVILMAISYAFGNVISRRNLSGTVKASVSGIVYQQHLAALGFLIPFCWLMEGSPVHAVQSLSLQTFLALAYLGIFSTGISILLFLHLMKTWGSLRASFITYLIPLVSITADFFINGTRLQAHQLGGGALILASLALMQLRWKKATSVQTAASGT